MVLVRLWLALGALGLGVGGRVWLLHRHGPTQVVALAQEVRLRVQTEAALAQDHARVVLLGARAMAGLQCRQVCRVAFAQELRREQELAWRQGGTGPCPVYPPPPRPPPPLSFLNPKTRPWGLQPLRGTSRKQETHYHLNFPILIWTTELA